MVKLGDIFNLVVGLLLTGFSFQLIVLPFGIALPIMAVLAAPLVFLIPPVGAILASIVLFLTPFGIILLPLGIAIFFVGINMLENGLKGTFGFKIGIAKLLNGIVKFVLSKLGVA